MDLDGLARHVGPEQFRRACARAMGTAPDTGRTLGRTEADDVPHELADLVEGDLPLAIALYRVMPCYANLMYVGQWAERDALFEELRSLLDEPADELAAPVAYWLWCGPFEGGEAEAAAAWTAVLSNAKARRLRRLLAASGPVPWSAKGPLLVGLAADVCWHPAIWAAVRDAAGDVFGRVDAPAALRLLGRLTRPPEHVDAADLRARLRDGASSPRR